jgi:predicted nucleic acid-binding protein
VDRVFLDANVLFSAAWREGSGLLRLWELPDVKLLTSVYAVEAARINLPDETRRGRLARLVERVEVISAAHSVRLPAGVVLPAKDQPVLSGAIQANASHLITGDKEHFGRFFGKRLLGVLILPPSEYLRRQNRGRSIHSGP